MAMLACASPVVAEDAGDAGGAGEAGIAGGASGAHRRYLKAINSHPKKFGKL